MASKKPWTIAFAQTAEKQLEKLDPVICRSINHYLLTRIATEEDPRRFGKPLTGNLKELWSYRVGDYRLVCDIQDNKRRVLIALVGHRRHVYTP